MASSGRQSARGARKSDALTVEACLVDARGGKPAPVYLLDGDAFLSGRGAQELAAALVPEAERALNVVELDPASSPAEVAAELRTRGLFAGPSSRKVVIVTEPAFLSAKEDNQGAFDRARDLWGKGRSREAARRLLALAAGAGWRARDLAALADGEAGAAWKQLGIDLGASGHDFVVAAGRWAAERDLEAARGGDAGALDAVLAQGLPPGHVLIVAAGKVDGRLPLVKRLAAMGRRVTLGVQKEGTWQDERLVLRPILDDLLRGTGKRADAGAEARLAERVGEDARTLASEVAKLIAYVGDRATITAGDVDAVVTRVAPDPFFALGNAVESRDRARALAVLDRSLTDGASEFMLLATLASTIRRLVVERERARKAAGERRIATFDAWQAAVLPRIPEREIAGKKPYGFWMKYQAAQRFRREALLRALVDLAEADVAMKSGGGGRELLERVLWRVLEENGE